MRKCASCKHWEMKKGIDSTAYGECQAIYQKRDQTPGDGIKANIVASPGSFPVFLTRGDFGCVLHSE